MAEPGSRRGRTHDAEGAREAILNAAEEVFAQHGFDGARIDAIAAAAGYNKSLIFQYFGDKLGLYGAVIRRADAQTSGLQTEFMDTFLKEDLLTDPGRLRTLLRIYLGGYFDYLVAHPRFMRILLWEMAEGWQTYVKIITQRDLEDVDRFMPLLQKVQNAGLLRSDHEPMAQVLLLEFIYPAFLAVLPLYQSIMPGVEIASPEALARAREFVIEFAVHGFLADSPKKP